MAQVWEVVGGVDKGGILVRQGADLRSEQCTARLAPGALVEERQLLGHRLAYALLAGSGPREGWVSTEVAGKALLVRSEKRFPNEDDSEDSPDKSREPASGKAKMPSVYALSDLHTDHAQNMNLFRDLPRCPDDVVILAGDISDNLDCMRETLQLFTSKFGYVFYCPGNHDLWLRPQRSFKDSLEKLDAVLALCKELGVHTQPQAVGDHVLIVPMFAWYEGGFDCEPDILDDSLAPVEKSMMDFMLCKWPFGLSAVDGSLAEHMDGLNWDPPSTERFDVVISFSHFLPLPELLPEKRYLFYPHLAKAVGSRALGQRVRGLKPHCHVFGHTHFGWDAEIGGIRYLQAAVAYPKERDTRGFSLELCDDDAEVVGARVAGGVTSPILVFDSKRQEFPCYRGFWSDYYAKHRRRPSDICWSYRGERDSQAVRLAVRQLVHDGEVVDDEGIERILRSGLRSK